MMDSKPILAYIASDVRSGSTLLDLLLGSHPETTSVGELRYLRNHYQREGVGWAWDWRCTCGQPLESCSFWSDVAGALRESEGLVLEDLPVNAVVSHVGFPLLVFRQTGRLVPSIRRSTSSATNCWKVIDAVAATTGKRVVVDSSKTAEQFRHLYLQRPRDIRLVYLVRDGRGVALSRMQRNRTTLVRASLLWVRSNLKILLMWMLVPKDRRLLVVYEELCRNPEAEIAKIWAFLGLEPSAVELRKNNRHNIAGSPHRFLRSDTEITVDERWRTALSRRDLNWFAAIGGWLNRQFGYR
jgi:hypothetical protein